MKNRNEDNVVFTIIQHFTKVFSKFLQSSMCKKYKLGNILINLFNWLSII
jgi:hypothetical protein